jgi:hypothetical protein
MKNYFILLVLLSSIFSSSIFAQSFSAITFETQHETKMALDNITNWVFFAKSKDGSKMLQQVFKDLKVDKQWLVEKKAIYVGDISGMPSLIARFFALPKMRDYNFPIALDKEGDITKDWQGKTEFVTIYKIKNLQVLETIQLDEVDKLKQFMLNKF